MQSNFLEKDLEDIIIDNIPNIYERGFPKLYANVIRQFHTISNRRIDIFAFEIVNNILYAQIIELKKDSCGVDAMRQVIEYYDDILIGVYKSYDDFFIDIILVGKEIDYDLCRFNYLTPHLSLYQYKYDYDGIKFIKDGVYIENCKNKNNAQNKETEISIRLNKQQQ